MSRSLSFSKRTVAIALAASVVASGAQVVAPSLETLSVPLLRRRSRRGIFKTAM